MEDDQLLGEILESLLRDLGHVPICVLDAAAAIAVLESQPNTIDLMLADVCLPQTNGLELAHMVRLRWPYISIALTTGDVEQPPEGERLGFHVLRKPYSIEALAQFIDAEIATVANVGNRPSGR